MKSSFGGSPLPCPTSPSVRKANGGLLGVKAGKSDGADFDVPGTGTSLVVLLVMAE